MSWFQTAKNKHLTFELIKLCILSSRSAALAQTEMGVGVEDEVVDEDEELRRALALSRQDIDVEDEEADLRRAIQLSMQGKGFPSSFAIIIIL